MLETVIDTVVRHLAIVLGSDIFAMSKLGFMVGGNFRLVGREVPRVLPSTLIDANPSCQTITFMSWRLRWFKNVKSSQDLETQGHVQSGVKTLFIRFIVVVDL